MKFIHMKGLSHGRFMKRHLIIGKLGNFVRIKPCRAFAKFKNCKSAARLNFFQTQKCYYLEGQSIMNDDKLDSRF